MPALFAAALNINFSFMVIVMHPMSLDIEYLPKIPEKTPTPGYITLETINF